MGDHADDCINAGIDSCWSGGFNYWRRPVLTMSKYEFKRIVRETDKARLVEMSGGKQWWLPKTVHKIHEDNILSIYDWFTKSIMFGKAI